MTEENRLLGFIPNSASRTITLRFNIGDVALDLENARNIAFRLLDVVQKHERSNDHPSALIAVKDIAVCKTAEAGADVALRLEAPNGVGFEFLLTERQKAELASLLQTDGKPH